MNRAKTTKIVLFVLLGLFVLLAFVPTLHRQEQKLHQKVACVKQICIDDGDTVTCTNVTPQVAHYQVTNDRNGSSLKVTLTGKSCF